MTADMTYIDLFRNSVSRAAGSTATVDFDGSRATTYAELDDLSSRVAGKLRRLGCAPGDFVLIDMDRRMEYIAAYLGVLKAGCVVVPASPHYPRERVAFMREDCGSRLTVTGDFLDDVRECEPLCEPAEGEAPALLVYTSGSTGRPKGILHDAAGLAAGIVRHFVLLEGFDNPSMASVSPFTFAIHIFDFLVPLACAGTVHILGEEQRRSPALISSYCTRHRIDAAFITPQMLRCFRPGDALPARVLAGGEAVVNLYFPGTELYDVYGQSETCGLVCSFLVREANPNTPIGKGFPGLEMLILQDDGTPAPDSQNGEICIAGEFGVQYFKDPERTAATFVRQPHGRTLIHTGDVGFRNADGDIVYVSRSDWMVKINGQRVEALEVERALASVEGIENAAVRPFTDENGQNYIAGYYESAAGISENDIRAALGRVLPDYMIPRYLVRMASLPRNANGKLDRTALEQPDKILYKSAYAAPESEAQQALCNAFSQVLHCGEAGIDDDFFALGGDSIKVLQLLSASGLETLSSAMVFQGRTPRGIAALCESGQDLIPHTDEIPACLPLSESQKGVYMQCLEDPESLMYNIPMMHRLPAGTDAGRYVDAVKGAVLAHEALQVTVASPDGVPSMLYSPAKAVAVAEKQVADLERECRAFVRPFDLERGPLYRFELCHAPEGDVLLFDVHHIVFDGTSVGVLLSDIATLYEGGEISPERLTQFDVARAEAHLHDSAAYAQAREYFASGFDGVEWSESPVPDVVVPDAPQGAGSITLGSAPKFSVRDVSAFARKSGITENTVFLTAFAYALSKLCGRTESTFCTAYSGRHDSRLDRSVGMFVRTLPMHVSIDDSARVSDVLKEVQGEFFLTMKHDCIPFSELAAEYGAGIGVSFIYQSELLEGAEFLETGDSQSDLDLMLMRDAGGYKLLAHWRRSLYTEGFVRSFADMFLTVVQGMLTADTFAQIRFVDGDAAALLDGFNRTEYPWQEDSTVPDLFRAQAAKTPADTCLVCQDNTYTYAEVDSLTERLARHIAGTGLGKGSVVGVLVERDEYVLICSLGALKAGCAYLPLDPGYPRERLELMLQDSGASMLICSPSLEDAVSFEGPRMRTDEIPALGEGSAPLPQVSPDDLFVIIYTSGSTGTPKGVEFCHSNAVCSIEGFSRKLSIDSSSRQASYASYGFDAHVLDIYPAVVCGGQLHIIPEEMRLDLVAVQEYFNRRGITHVAMTTQVGRQFALMGGGSPLTIVVAGEKLTPLVPPEGINVYNGYGPTEGSVCTSLFKVDRLYRDVPIGTPTDNLKAYVVDKGGRLLPPGACGELWISGPHVTRGYHNRPEKTAEAYGPNTFQNLPGYERIYRTGDIIRFNPDGRLQFIGRRDSQVKVRGFRIELTEVEEVVRRFPGIKDATVAAFDEPSGGKYICAYVVSDAPVSADALADFIRAEKPPYMVPAVTMQIDSIPLNRNQKVDKRALPKPERKAADCTPPENETQRRIFDIAADVLGHRDFGIHTSVYEAGLTSIGALKLNIALGKEFNRGLRISDIKENDTVVKLERFLASAAGTAVAGIQDDYPLMQNQTGVLLDCLKDKQGLDYNIPTLFKLSDCVDVQRLREAVAAAIDAHPYIKATLFSNSSGDFRVRRSDGAAPVVEIVEVSALPGADALVRPFDLMGGVLYRACIYVTGSGKYLFLDIHHIVSDGTSTGILLSDINAAYEGSTPEAETFTGFDAALEEERLSASDGYASGVKYYEGLLSGCNTDCLPAPCGEDDAASARGKTVDFPMGGVSAAISAWCEANSLSANAFFNAVFGYTLSRFIHGDDVTWATVYNGRSDSRLARCFSMLVKTLPVRAALDYAAAPVSLALSLRRQLLDSMSNDIVPFSELSAVHGVRADMFFNYQGDNFNFDSIAGAPAQLVPLEVSQTKAPLSLEVFLQGGEYTLRVTYASDRYCADFVQAFAGAFIKAAGEFTVKQKLSEVSLLTDAEAEQFARMNDNDTPFEMIPEHKIFERCAAAAPDAVAVITSGTSVTFAQLDTMANSIANSLVALGLEKDECVGLILDRGVNVPAAELGIMKAGGAFLPMLPSYPDDRVTYCLEDARCRFLVTSRDLIVANPWMSAGGAPCKSLAIEDLLGTDGSRAPETEVPMDSLAYCIYTSGSTGKPKGVMIEHRNLTSFTQTGDLRRLVQCGDTELCMASISFDMSLAEILLPLCMGKSIYIASEDEIHNPLKLVAAFENHGIDLMCVTPSFAWSMLEVPGFEKAAARVKAICLGAEAVPKTLCTRLWDLNPEMIIINGYGPTECVQACSSKVIDRDSEITIGRPFPNVKYYVSDSGGNLLPRYAAGELMICGGNVGRGYVGLPEKNKAAFTLIDGLRAYHSGDLVRINRDLETEFFGRVDNQVKLRGFRVELDEIENSICSFPSVRQSKVVVRGTGSEAYLAAFFTASSQVDVEALTAHLKAALPSYMVPAAIMQIESMPKTPSGKIDKKALPETTRTAVRSGSRKAARKSLEQRLCDMFASVLGIPEVFADDNFFELGGTSLSASKVTMQLMSEGIEVEYGDIFDNATPESLAGFIEKRTSSAPAPAAVQVDTACTRDAVKYNSLKYASEIKREPLGGVLLTGTTGFLGIHVLRALLEREEGHVWCLVRKGRYESCEYRLRSLLFYYFDDAYSDLMRERVSVIDADITDPGLDAALGDISFDTVINCAASVKHFSDDDSIGRINVGGVRNLLEMCRRRGARMVQISTTSVPGMHTADTYERKVVMHENEHFIVDAMDNKYVLSKYAAEQLVFDAVESGARAKVIRVGNLMGRHSDGEFQINMHTNMFMNGIRGFHSIGKCPVSHMTDTMRFSPIDCTAEAVVLLAGTPDKFTAFNADNRYSFDEMKVIDACNKVGVQITPVEDEEYYADFRRRLGDGNVNSDLSALAAYDRPDLHVVLTDNTFTAAALYRLGFSWPLADESYLERTMQSLVTLGYFDL